MHSQKWFVSAMMYSCLIAIVLTCFFSTDTRAASRPLMVASGNQKTTAPQSPNSVRTGSPILNAINPPTNWKQYDGDPGRFNRSEKTLSKQNVAKLHPVWAQSVDDVIMTSPVIVNSVVYVVGFFGAVGAFDALSGQKLWSTQLVAPGCTTCMQINHFSTPAVDNGMLYIGTDLGIVYALNTSNGKQAWYYKTRALSLEDSLAVANGMVYFGTSGVANVTISGAKLYALNGKTGKVAWTYALNHWMPNTSINIANNTIYVSPDFDTHQLLAINATTGKLLWKVAGFVATNVVVDNNTVYGTFSDMQTQRNGVAALNATTGKFLWKNLLTPQNGHGTEYGVGGLAVGNGKLYGSGIESASNTTYGYQPYIYSFNATTGKLLWKKMQESDEYGYYDAILANGVLYFASSEAFFIAYDAQTGTKLWRSDFVGSEMQSPPLIANGRLYGTSNTGQIIAMSITQ